MPATFLMQQMEWRESLEDASTIEDLTALQAEVNVAKDVLLSECARSIDTEQDFPGAVQRVRALMFLDKFGLDLDRHFEKFE